MYIYICVYIYIYICMYMYVYAWWILMNHCPYRIGRTCKSGCLVNADEAGACSASPKATIPLEFQLVNKSIHKL